MKKTANLESRLSEPKAQRAKGRFPTDLDAALPRLGSVGIFPKTQRAKGIEPSSDPWQGQKAILTVFDIS